MLTKKIQDLIFSAINISRPSIPGLVRNSFQPFDVTITLKLYLSSMNILQARLLPFQRQSFEVKAQDV
jgi:hypothetical protein